MNPDHHSPHRGPWKLPGIGEKLLLFLLPVELQDEIIGDLTEIFQHDVGSENVGRAQQNFWWEFIQMIPFLLRKFTHKLLLKRSTMQLFPPNMAPSRKRRIIAAPIVYLLMLSVTLAMTFWFVSWIDTLLDYSEDLPNRATAMQLCYQLADANNPEKAPAIAPYFREFIADSTIRSTEVPRFPAPYSKFLHPFYGYRFHGKLVIKSPTLPLDSIPTALIERTLNEWGQVPLSDMRKQIVNILNRKVRNKTNLDSTRILEQQLQKMYRNPRYNPRFDSLWLLRMSTLPTSDTTYFHGLLTNRRLSLELLPEIWKLPTNWWNPMFHFLASPPDAKDVLEKASAEQFALLAIQDGKIVYQRGDSIHYPKRVYTLNANKLTRFGEQHPEIVVFRYDKMNPAKFIHKYIFKIVRIQWYAFLAIIVSALALVHYRGYNSRAKRRAKEQEWENEHRNPPPS